MQSLAPIFEAAAAPQGAAPPAPAPAPAPRGERKRRRPADDGSGDGDGGLAALGGRLFARSPSAGRIVYMSDAVERYCGLGSDHESRVSQLNVVHAGCTVFRRKRSRQVRGEAAQARPTPEGTLLLAQRAAH